MDAHHDDRQGQGTARPAASATTLHGWPLALARASWIALVLLTLGLLIAAASVRYPQMSNPDEAVRAGLAQLGLPVAAYAAYVIASQVVAIAVFFAVAALIFWRRSDDWLALFVSLLFVTLGVNPDTAALTQIHPDLGTVGEAVGDLAWTSLIVFFYIFPDGRFVPRWTQGVAIFLVALQGASMVFPDRPFSIETWPPALSFLFLAGLLGLGAVSQIYRYRRLSGPVQRQQTKWAVFGATVAIGILICLGLPFTVIASLGAASPSYGLLAEPAIPLVLCLIPLSTGMAILRARLWEIDLLINRALVYGTLTVSLAAVYLGSVLVLQGAFHALSGQDSNLAIVVSTLAAAALFRPLRARLQAVIDRRFYRRKYDAARTLAAFSALLRDEVDLVALEAALLRMVDETMQPAHVWLWLRPAPDAAPRGDLLSADVAQ